MRRKTLIIISATVLLLVVFTALVSIRSVGKPRTSTASEHVTSAIAGDYAGVVNYLGLVVLVDNYPYNKSLVTAWGLSIYCVTDNVRFLFDTGPDGSVIHRNSEALGINLSSLDFIVLSHEHGDHVGGLGYLAKSLKNIKVYVPSSSKSLISYVSELGLKPIPVHDTIAVSKGVYIIGEVYGPPYEIAVAINTSKGFVVIVGCSHAGITTILRKVCRDLGGNIYAVIGGFHLFSAPKDVVVKVAKEMISMEVRKIYPIHCSGDYIRYYLASNYPAIYGDGGVGLKIVVRSN